MRIVKFMALAVLAIGIFPMTASATHFESVVFSGDCDGWTLEVEIRYRNSPEFVLEAELEYSINLLDLEENLLEAIDWSGVVSRPEGSGTYHTYIFSGEWDGGHPAGQFLVQGSATLTAPYAGGVEVDTATFEDQFECDVVSTQATTWTGIKGLYR